MRGKGKEVGTKKVISLVYKYIHVCVIRHPWMCFRR